METQLNCIPCFIDDIIGGINLIEKDDKIKKRLVSDIINYFAEEGIDYSKTPSYYITRVHRIIKKYYGKDNLFKDIRDKCNEVGLKLSEKIGKELATEDEINRFKKLVKWAITGNELDFRTVGTGYNLTLDDFYNILYKTYEIPLDIDESEKIHALLPKTDKILYVLDNVGEIAFDKLLIEFFVEKGKEVSVVYRGGAITSDIIIEDLDFVGISDMQVKTVLAGPDTLGISFEEMSDELKKEIEQADMLISKGQANYYEFSKHFKEINGEIINLLRTKCDFVSKKFGKSGKLGLAVILREEFI